ncbi:MAG: aspartate-semialdehyde dehydrogenase [Thermoanaerobaculia bacterium]|nr:aspartate-semialdehyde dehydrogenase [Thermoanaerobaculia bacterium]
MSSTVTPSRSSSVPKIPVGVLGATGSVGQRFITLLRDHPWFELTCVTGSDRSIGRRYGEAAHWALPDAMPSAASNLVVERTGRGLSPQLLFSALSSEVAREVERDLAAAGHFVVSNASAHRMDPDVPLMVPEVNEDHLGLLERQSFPKGGALVTNPNCSTIGLVLALAPLHEAFGIEALSVVTLQALSGAGIPGVPSMVALDNVVPYIGNEEEKLETEPLRILGTLGPHGIEAASFTVSAQCNRVAVSDGHTECLSLRLRGEPSVDAVTRVLESYRSPTTAHLPTAPDLPIVVTDQPDRPQPRLDRDRGGGMSVTVGRIRPCPLFGIKMVVLSHNTLRGAAGGSLLVAEQVVAKGLIPGLRAPSPAVRE